ncbi:MAG: NfeD family protein [Parvularculaceae bacterium]
MGGSGLESLPPAALAAALFFLGCVAFTAIKILWGVAQWTKRSEHRVGERWGGEHVEVVEWSGSDGYVRAGGELWRATSADALSPGDQVRVARVDGLILSVRKK